MRPQDPKTTMTPRQVELLALYASGHQIREIAEMKFLSIDTVQKTLALARERVGARSLAHLCVICLDNGVIRQNGVGYKPVQEERIIAE